MVFTCKTVYLKPAHLCITSAKAEFYVKIIYRVQIWMTGLKKKKIKIKTKTIVAECGLI